MCPRGESQQFISRSPAEKGALQSYHDVESPFECHLWWFSDRGVQEASILLYRTPWLWLLEGSRGFDENAFVNIHSIQSVQWAYANHILKCIFSLCSVPEFRETISAVVEQCAWRVNCTRRQVIRETWKKNSMTIQTQICWKHIHVLSLSLFLSISLRPFLPPSLSLLVSLFVFYTFSVASFHYYQRQISIHRFTESYSSF